MTSVNSLQKGFGIKHQRKKKPISISTDRYHTARQCLCGVIVTWPCSALTNNWRFSFILKISYVVAQTTEVGALR